MKRAGKNWAMLLGGMAISGAVFCAQAQPITESGSLGRDGTEYFITSTGRLPGEQTNPSLALGSQGGFLVWQDNVSDLDGLGISAQYLDADLQPVGGEFRVNETEVADQEAPQAALLSQGQALFVWQSGVRGMQKICYRLLSADGIFGSEANLAQQGLNQKDVRIAALSDGSAVVTWSATDASGKPQGVYMQKISAEGQAVGKTLPVVAATGNRSSSVSALPEGGFAVAWLAESIVMSAAEDNQYTAASIVTEIKVRVFANDLTPSGAVQTVSPAGAIVSNPALAVGSYGMGVAWSVVDLSGKVQTWNVGGAVLDNAGSLVKSLPVLNTCLEGDQFIPQIAAAHENYFAVWTSLRQDGSYEGVFGRLLNASGFVSDEVQVNTTTLLRQITPTVAAQGDGFLVSWSSYLPGVASLDLMAQRYVSDSEGTVLDQPQSPTACALSEYEIFVSWPAVAGRAVKSYELYIDEQPALTLSDNFYTLSDLLPSTARTFKYRYTLESGVISPLSEPVSVTSWGADKNRDGLPDDWQALYWGTDKAKWPASLEDSDGDGVSNLDEFLAGTDPKDATSALKTSLKVTSQGVRLQWNTVPGLVYQVQYTEDAKAWNNLGAVRRATSSTDSIALESSRKVSFYRIVRVSK